MARVSRLQFFIIRAVRYCGTLLSFISNSLFFLCISQLQVIEELIHSHTLAETNMFTTLRYNSLSDEPIRVERRQFANVANSGRGLQHVACKNCRAKKVSLPIQETTP